MIVREFSGDVEEIRPIALRWKDECNDSLGIVIDDDIYMANLQEFSDKPDNILLVLVDDGIVGYMGLNTFVSPMGHQVICNEHYWYVLPEKRGISAIRLVKAAHQWAKKKGCSHVLMSASNLASGLHDRVCQIYKTLGMSKFETTYIKEL